MDIKDSSALFEKCFRGNGGTPSRVVPDLNGFFYSNELLRRKGIGPFVQRCGKIPREQGGGDFRPPFSLAGRLFERPLKTLLLDKLFQSYKWEINNTFDAIKP
ncbi:hypothetical protein CEXT_109041 [Caerostris extrusa]|uniref:Uncharacterized protein n=1 Tax=Caerostris extrusa TaxID=172846 RepID=A0AAV4VI77_CAEEX|nr:hypothetical protein CEXT_109041 [Caerostris extrusa]